MGRFVGEGGFGALKRDVAFAEGLVLPLLLPGF